MATGRTPSSASVLAVNGVSATIRFGAAWAGAASATRATIASSPAIRLISFCIPDSGGWC